MYFRDLDICRYGDGPFNSADWAVPLRAIGWIEDPRPFTRGPAPPQLARTLSLLVDQSVQVFDAYFLGTMDCSVCAAFRQPSPGPVWSQEILLVPGPKQVFCAPGGIVHYVEAHHYLPPRAFIDAVLTCPLGDHAAYLNALREANDSRDPPLELAPRARGEPKAAPPPFDPFFRTRDS